MKDSVSGLDIAYLVEELQFLVGGRIQKIFTEDKTVRIRIYVSGSGEEELYLAPGRMFLTMYRRENQLAPAHFCLFLRKYMQDKRITEIRQRGFDRIVEIVCEDVILIYELFATGNIILTDKDYRIIMPFESQVWKDRRIVPKERYAFPSSNEDPSTMDAHKLLEIFKAKPQTLVQALAFLGFGGTYAEELCLRLGMDKNKDATKLTAEEAFKISEGMEDIFSQEVKPMIIFKDEKKDDFAPFEMEVFKDWEREEFPTFSKTLDKYFSEEEIKLLTKRGNKALDEKKKKIQTKIDEQKSAVEKFVKREEESRLDAQALEMEYPELERILFTIQKFMKDKESWDKIKPQMATMFKVEVDEKHGLLKANLAGRVITLDFRIGPRENIKLKYQSAKNFAEKQEGAIGALKNSEAELASLSSQEVKVPKIVEKRKKKWSEKFRWFITSDGFLCVGGRDATLNEIVIKKHTDAHDIVFHADIHGSPFVVIKTGGKQVTQDTLNEAAMFTASYCSAWKDGRAVDVYWVKPDQVRKDAPAGMYVSKGSFMIYGNKNYIKKVGLGIAVGLVPSQEGLVVMAGPEPAIKSHAKVYLRVIPGSTEQNSVAKILKHDLLGMLHDDERLQVSSIPLEEFQRVLPSGTSNIVDNS